MHRYHVHGLCLTSEIALPELPVVVEPDAVEPRFCVVAGAVPKADAEDTESSDRFQVRDGKVYFEVDDVARYLIEDGRKITFQPEPGAPLELIRLFLYGAAFSALLQQCALMPLHASAVVINGRAVAFSAPTRHGKSTLASTFGTLGYPILADDKIVMLPSGHGRLMAHPGPPSLSLVEKAARASGQQRSSRASALKKFGKHTYLVPDQYAQVAYPIACLYFLEWGDDSEITIEHLSPFDALLKVRQNLEAGSLLGVLDQEGTFLEWAQALLRQAKAYSVKRPRSFTHQVELAHLVINRFASTHA